MQELRLLPLLASGTEIVHALGLGEYQVGRSHECDYPHSVSTLPVCTRPTIDVCGNSAEIDRLVKERVHSALSVYEVDSALVRELRPSHIITQTQCKVCAVSLDDVERATQSDLGTDARIVSLEPYTLADIWSDIRRVAAACEYQDRAEDLIDSLLNRMREMQARASRSSTRPSIAALEWLEPLMAAGNWVPELIAMANGRDVLLDADPDVILAQPCGFDLARTRSEMNWLTERAGWCDLKAVRTGRVFLCDGNQFLNRPGPRLVESLQLLAEILHPDLFPPTLEGIGWERFSPVSAASCG